MGCGVGCNVWGIGVLEHLAYCEQQPQNPPNKSGFIVTASFKQLSMHAWRMHTCLVGSIVLVLTPKIPNLKT